MSWLGAFTQDLDSYDEMGKISPVITTTQDIHVQDVIFIANDEVPNGTKLKEAMENICLALNGTPVKIIPFSSLTRVGKNELWNEILDSIQIEG